MCSGGVLRRTLGKVFRPVAKLRLGRKEPVLWKASAHAFYAIIEHEISFFFHTSSFFSFSRVLFLVLLLLFFLSILPFFSSASSSCFFFASNSTGNMAAADITSPHHTTRYCVSLHFCPGIHVSHSFSNLLFQIFFSRPLSSPHPPLALPVGSYADALHSRGMFLP